VFGLSGIETWLCGLITVPMAIVLGVAFMLSRRQERREKLLRPPSPALAAWLPDPYARHELRYWDGTRWTVHVVDAGTRSSDPPGLR
jgi:uncharacterized protein DUF2510